MPRKLAAPPPAPSRVTRSGARPTDPTASANLEGQQPAASQKKAPKSKKQAKDVVTTAPSKSKKGDVSKTASAKERAEQPQSQRQTGSNSGAMSRNDREQSVPAGAITTQACENL